MQELWQHWWVQIAAAILVNIVVTAAIWGAKVFWEGRPERAARTASKKEEAEAADRELADMMIRSPAVAVAWFSRQITRSVVSSLGSLIVMVGALIYQFYIEFKGNQPALIAVSMTAALLLPSTRLMWQSAITAKRTRKMMDLSKRGRSLLRLKARLLRNCLVI